MKIKSNILLPALALMASAVVATAQDNPRPSPEEFRARMEDRLKTALKVTDDEWKVLQPLIEKVQTAQRESFGRPLRRLRRTRRSRRTWPRRR